VTTFNLSGVLSGALDDSNVEIEACVRFTRRREASGHLWQASSAVFPVRGGFRFGSSTFGLGDAVHGCRLCIFCGASPFEGLPLGFDCGVAEVPVLSCIRVAHFSVGLSTRR